MMLKHPWFSCLGYNKNKKYGMTKAEFDEYNKSRAVTLDNMIKRYGEDDGNRKYDEYCLRQSYAGCAKEYFIEKYGDVLGTIEWKNLNLKKRHSLDYFIKMFGSEIGEEKYKEHWNERAVSRKTLSLQSQELFNKLYEMVPKELKESIYYGTLNKEFGKYNSNIKSYHFYDFVINDIKFCIEYNGDYWHGNPKKYSGNVMMNVRNMTYKEIWDYDKQKIIS